MAVDTLEIKDFLRLSVSDCASLDIGTHRLKVVTKATYHLSKIFIYWLREYEEAVSYGRFYSLLIILGETKLFGEFVAQDWRFKLAWMFLAYNGYGMCSWFGLDSDTLQTGQYICSPAVLCWYFVKDSWEVQIIMIFLFEGFKAFKAVLWVYWEESNKFGNCFGMGRNLKRGTICTRPFCCFIFKINIC